MKLNSWMRIRISTALVAASLLLPLHPALAQSGGRDVISEVRESFDEAMGQPLSQRVAELAELDDRIDRALLEQVSQAKGRCDLAELQYRVRIEMAEYPGAHKAFERYAAELKAWGDKPRARVSLREFVRNTAVSDPAEAVALSKAALTHWRGDAKAEPALLYHQARALSRLTGRADEAVPVLKSVIEQFPESPWRPKAMRQLGHLQANGYGAGHEAALQTLSLLEMQYAGTWWEQYAHMKPAVIYEVRMGEPQEALARYEATLEKFPDHKYAPYCRRQIDRLQEVIEQQLIDDALEGLGRKEQPEEPEELRHRSGELIGFRIELDPDQVAAAR